MLKNFLWEKEKTFDFLIGVYITYKSGTKNFQIELLTNILKISINT